MMAESVRSKWDNPNYAPPSSFPHFDPDKFKADGLFHLSYGKDFTTESILAKPPEYRTEEEAKALAEYMKTLKYFRDMAPALLFNLAGVITQRRLKAGGMVYNEGDLGAEVFVVRSGSVGIQVRDFLSDTGSHVSGMVSKGRSFGDGALNGESSHRRAVTMVCTEDTDLLVLKASVYKGIAEKATASELHLKFQFLRRLGLFDAAKASEVLAVAQVLKKRRYPKNAVVVRQGEPSDCMFFIASGEARAIQRVAAPHQHGAHGRGRPPINNELLLDLGVVKQEWFFGELGLVQDAPRSCFVYANTPLECFTLNKEAFKQQMPVDCKEYFYNYIKTFYAPQTVVEEQVKQEQRWSLFKTRMLSRVNPSFANQDTEGMEGTGMMQGAGRPRQARSARGTQEGRGRRQEQALEVHRTRQQARLVEKEQFRRSFSSISGPSGSRTARQYRKHTTGTSAFGRNLLPFSVADASYEVPAPFDLDLHRQQARALRQHNHRSQ